MRDLLYITLIIHVCMQERPDFKQILETLQNMLDNGSS